MTSNTWADAARTIIQCVIAKVGREDMKALKKALHDAYPFGERRYFPYKVWCREVRRVMTGAATRAQREALEPKGQPNLFKEIQ